MKTKIVPLSILCRMHWVSNYGDLFLMVSWTSQFSWFWGPGGVLAKIWLDWQIWPSGRELGSQPQAPGSIPPSPPYGIPVGSNLVASRQRTLRGLFFAKKSVLKMRNSGIPGFLWKCWMWIIMADLALCAGSNIRASRQHTLRFLATSPFWKWETVDFNERIQILIIPV